MPTLDDELTPREMRHWLSRIESAVTRLDSKVDTLPFIRSDVYEGNRQLLKADINANRALVTNLESRFNLFRSFMIRLAGWGISGLMVLGGGAFALFHR